MTVFFRVAGPLAWPDAKENDMTVTTAGNLEQAPALVAAVGPGSS